MVVMEWLSRFFGRAGGAQPERDGMKRLGTQAQFEAVLAESEQRPVFVFKHSTACPVSGMAHDEVTGYLREAGDEAAPLYILLVIESRGLSNRVAERLGIPHESPQLLLIRNGKVRWHASHGGVNAPAIERAVHAATA